MKIKLLYEDAYVPTRGSEQAAGLDLYAYDDIDKEHEFLIRPGEVLKISTGIAIALDPGTVALILPRSGLATKKGLRPANTPGLIDADYRGPVIVALRNDSKEDQYVKAGERIAQMMIIPYVTGYPEIVDKLDDTKRGSCGFGSTGVN